MISALHKNHGVYEGIHQVHNWEFDNEASRLSYTRYTDNDVGKVAFQTDNKTFWILTQVSPSIVFFQLGLEGSLDENSHETLKQLIHLAEGGPFEGFSGAYKEILPQGSAFPESIIWWQSSAKAGKILEKTIVRNSNQLPTQITYIAYEGNGVDVASTAIDTIEYSGVFEINREREIV